MKVSIARFGPTIFFSLGTLLLFGCSSSQDSAENKVAEATAPSPRADSETTPLTNQPELSSQANSPEFPAQEAEEEPSAEDMLPDLDQLLDGDTAPAKPKRTKKTPPPRPPVDNGEAKAAPPFDEVQMQLRNITEHAYQVGTAEGSGAGFAGETRGRSQLPPGSIVYSHESYNEIVESPFRKVIEHPLSTFSIDVDTAAYSNMRRYLTMGRLPPIDSVRIEEMLNYFTYNYPQPKGKAPFAAAVEIAAHPWNEKYRLVRVGIQGRKIEAAQRPACNLVFLIDTSGSMRAENKLPLVMRSLLLMTEQLNEKDRVGIVTYAGTAGVLLPAVAGDEYESIERAINSLRAGGSTNGSGGIQMAYEIARQNFSKSGVNRVILATDGDFNVGTTSQAELVSLIEKEATSGVFLSVLGYGMGNLKDSTLESLADKGNGNYAYIDTMNESRKVLGEQLLGTLITIAKDVKIQIEFNPARVAAYRLIGYENRLLQKEDFNDDKKDAGEIGAGHSITALYEIVPMGVAVPASVDPLKYQKTEEKLTRAAQSDELLTLKLRYKEPGGENSKLVEIPVKDRNRKFTESSKDFQFAASVASFGMQLRQSKFRGDISLDGILEIANSAKGEDRFGYRAEFVQLVQCVKELQH